MRTGIILCMAFLLMASATAGAATIVINVTAPTYNSVPAGGLTTLNYSDSVIVNIISNSTNSIVQSYTIAAPPVKTVTNNVTVNRTVYVSNSFAFNKRVSLGYNGTFYNSSTNLTVTSAPYPSWNSTIELSQCGINGSITVNSITVVANAPPCLDIQMNDTRTGNESTFMYSNRSYGNNVSIVSRYAADVRATVPFGGSWTMNAINATVLAEKLTANSINETDMQQYWNGKVGECNGYENFTDSTGSLLGSYCISSSQAQLTWADVCTQQELQQLPGENSTASGLTLLQCLTNYGNQANVRADQWEMSYNGMKVANHANYTNATDAAKSQTAWSGALWIVAGFIGTVLILFGGGYSVINYMANRRNRQDRVDPRRRR